MTLDFLRDENGKGSATRIILVLITIVFMIASITDVFTAASVDPLVYSIVQTVYGFGLGGQAIRTTVKNMNYQPFEQSTFRAS